jgi:hypothetical protein
MGTAVSANPVSMLVANEVKKILIDRKDWNAVEPITLKALLDKIQERKSDCDSFEAYVASGSLQVSATVSITFRNQEGAMFATDWRIERDLVKKLTTVTPLGKRRNI